MAKELAHFKNFAKLKNTSVAFNDITVLAGKPGTGKSYVMKMIYAIDEAYTKIINDTNALKNKEELITKKIDSLLKDKDFLLTVSGEEKEKLIFDVFELKKNWESIKNKKENMLGMMKSTTIDVSLVYENMLKAIFSSLNDISTNFIVEYKETEIEYFNQTLTVREDDDGRAMEASKIFVETPLILEFKKFMKREEGKTPYHIESLLNILDIDYSFADEEQDKFIKSFTQKSKEIIQGDIESSGDSFIFNKEDDKSYDITNASSGIKSIGLLQYLVTNKALKKGSVLFWEEPEVHLHPEWQLRMVELFVELMNAGVKIVFSTHSPYMCDYLNAISRKKGLSDRVSFNLLKENNGIVENYILESDEDWNKIQAELLDPLEEIVWEYI